MPFMYKPAIEAAAQVRTLEFADLLESICSQEQLDQIETWADPPEAKAARIEQARELLASAGVALPEGE